MNGPRDRSGLHVVLTMRGVRTSKRRLETAFDGRQREALNRWLLARTLEVVARWHGGLGRCVFVSACDEALAAAANAGAHAVEEPGGAGGHNHAAAIGVAHATALGAREAMMLPCDLPLLAPDALDAFAALADGANLVLAPDRHGTGTNALIIDARAGLEFKFGDGSLGRYDAWARETRRAVALCTRRELALDLDTPEDFAAWHALPIDDKPALPERADNEEETL